MIFQETGWTASGTALLPVWECVHWRGWKARLLLKESGYTAWNPLKITYKTSSNPFRVRLATIIQSQLEAVGIDVNVRTYDWGTFYGDEAHDERHSELRRRDMC